MPEKQILEQKFFTRKMSDIHQPNTLPMVAENEYRTFTVGATHFVSPSSPFWDWLNAGICSRRTVRIASGESQD
jgi:hypothetical protein